MRRPSLTVMVPDEHNATMSPAIVEKTEEQSGTVQTPTIIRPNPEAIAQAYRVAYRDQHFFDLNSPGDVERLTAYETSRRSEAEPFEFKPYVDPEGLPLPLVAICSALAGNKIYGCHNLCLIAQRDYAAGEPIAHYDGERIDNGNPLGFYTLQIKSRGQNYVVKADHCGNFARYANETKKPTALYKMINDQPYIVAGPNGIQAGQEISVRYNGLTEIVVMEPTSLATIFIDMLNYIEDEQVDGVRQKLIDLIEEGKCEDNTALTALFTILSTTKPYSLDRLTRRAEAAEVVSYVTYRFICEMFGWPLPEKLSLTVKLKRQLTCQLLNPVAKGATSIRLQKKVSYHLLTTAEVAESDLSSASVVPDSASEHELLTDETLSDEDELMPSAEAVESEPTPINALWINLQFLNCERDQRKLDIARLEELITPYLPQLGFAIVFQVFYLKIYVALIEQDYNQLERFVIEPPVFPTPTEANLVMQIPDDRRKLQSLSHEIDQFGEIYLQSQGEPTDYVSIVYFGLLMNYKGYAAVLDNSFQLLHCLLQHSDNYRNVLVHHAIESVIADSREQSIIEQSQFYTESLFSRSPATSSDTVVQHPDNNNCRLR